MYADKGCRLNKSGLDPQLVSRLESEGVDLARMIRFLDDLNEGKYDESRGILPDSVPDLSNPAIIDRRSSATWTMDAAAACARFRELGLPFAPESVGRAGPGGTVSFDEGALDRIGVHLYPKTAYGVLNGGSASSYADIKKNRGLDARAFEDNRALFDSLAQECRGKPKGITPAYINPDGSPGYSFLLMKFRMLLEHKKRYGDMVGRLPEVILPAFQMTSFHTDRPVQAAFRQYIMQPELKGLSDSLGCTSIEIYTATQTMMAAITHSSLGKPRRIFDTAFGKPHTGIALPGGHGQNFEILAPIYRKLHALGIRYVWIGNIDNMGYTVDPVSLAIFALSGKEAAFEAAWRTPVDVKGGILVCDAAGKMSCADIGPAITKDQVLEFERAGKPVLFNCGIGLFDLEKLIPRLESIPYQLPLRVTDQDKDAGLYAQAEQITWEVIGLLDDPLFFAVEKNRRFIAAKMLLETILTSLPPARGTQPAKRVSGDGEDSAASMSAYLHDGLTRLLSGEYGLVLKDDTWQIAEK